MFKWCVVISACEWGGVWFNDMDSNCPVLQYLPVVFGLFGSSHSRNTDIVAPESTKSSTLVPETCISIWGNCLNPSFLSTYI